MRGKNKTAKLNYNEVLNINHKPHKPFSRDIEDERLEIYLIWQIYNLHQILIEDNNEFRLSDYYNTLCAE